MHNFLIFIQIEGLKLLWNRHLKFYKSSCSSKGNRVIFKDFLSGPKIGYELFDWEFFVKTILLILKVIIFLPLICFYQFLAH